MSAPGSAEAGGAVRRGHAPEVVHAERLGYVIIGAGIQELRLRFFFTTYRIRR